MANDVGDLLAPISELLDLLWRHKHGRLSPVLRARARGLIRLLRSPGDDPRAFCRAEARGLVRLTPDEGPIVIGSVGDLGAGGLRISARRPPARGTRAVAHLTDPRAGVAYALPVVVAWAEASGEAGLRFTGRPHGAGTTLLPRERVTVQVRLWPGQSTASASRSSTEQCR